MKSSDLSTLVHLQTYPHCVVYLTVKVSPGNLAQTIESPHFLIEVTILDILLWPSVVNARDYRILTGYIFIRPTTMPPRSELPAASSVSTFRFRSITHLDIKVFSTIPSESKPYRDIQSFEGKSVLQKVPLRYIQFKKLDWASHRHRADIHLCNANLVQSNG